MTTRQLHLFKSRRQRGRRPAPALEYALHCMVADTIRRWIRPGWIFTHLPMGEYRDPVTAVKLKRMGVTPGWPDFVFFSDDGRVCFLELKRHGEGPSERQAAMALFLMQGGHGYLCTSSYDVAVRQLVEWEIVRRVIVQ